MGLYSHPAPDEAVLLGNGLAILNQAFHIACNSITGHIDGLLCGLSVGDASRKCWDQHGIASFWFPSKSDSITEGPHSSMNRR